MAKRVPAAGPPGRIDIQVEHWPIERLIPRANNPRTHSREQVASIAASMREFGFTNPILVGADDDIIAGHARPLAAEKLERSACHRPPSSLASPAARLGDRRQPTGNRRCRLGPHSFRRANITWRQEVGGSSIEASKIAGHSTVA